MVSPTYNKALTRVAEYHYEHLILNSLTSPRKVLTQCPIHLCVVTYVTFKLLEVRQRKTDTEKRY